jgi:hypothetical protein
MSGYTVQFFSGFWAMVTAIFLLMKDRPSSSRIACWASSSVAISTKPNPLGCPVWGTTATRTLTTSPTVEKNCLSWASVVLNDRLAT